MVLYGIWWNGLGNMIFYSSFALNGPWDMNVICYSLLSDASDIHFLPWDPQNEWGLPVALGFNSDPPRKNRLCGLNYIIMKLVFESIDILCDQLIQCIKVNLKYILCWNFDANWCMQNKANIWESRVESAEQKNNWTNLLKDSLPLFTIYSEIEHLSSFHVCYSISSMPFVARASPPQNLFREGY